LSVFVVDIVLFYHRTVLWLTVTVSCDQCSDAVGWAARRASGLTGGVLAWLYGYMVIICLERGADLHMAQLMPLVLTVSCFSKIQIDFTFLVAAHPGSTRVVLDKGPLKGCVCYG